MTEATHKRLTEHLVEVQNHDGMLALDDRLLDEAGLILPDQLSPDATLRLVKQISTLLRSIQTDPSPLAQLLERLVQHLSFADVLSFDPPINFAQGLQPVDGAASINMLILYLLQKATSHVDIATVAGWPEVVAALVKLWLETPDTGVAARAGALITGYLVADKPNKLDVGMRQNVSGPGESLMWKRMFADADVYGALLACCDLKSTGPNRSKRQTTLAQARLLEVLPTWASLDWSTVSRSHDADVEACYGVGSLMDFASLYMIDTEDDILTHVCLLDFFAHLLVATKKEIVSQDLSAGLNYLIQKGIHDKVANLYFADSVDDPYVGLFLYGPASRYLAVYSANYPHHYMSTKLPTAVEKRLFARFDQTPTRWSHTDPPTHDLKLLANLPRISLLPGRGGAKDWSSNPLIRLPSASVPAEVLDTLAIIFHGPEQELITFPAASPMVDTDHADKVANAAAARTLYFQYLARHRTLWKDVVAHAETVAILDRALAALNLLAAVITANWSAEQEFDLPSDIIATPETGVMAILSPPALEHIIPYLNRPAQSFSNLVGGRGDAESSAYKIAVAKFDALRALHTRLAAHLERVPDLDLQAVLSTLQKRLAEGPLSQSGEVGGRIATLEL